AVVTACVRIAVYPSVAATSGLYIDSTYRCVYRQVKHYDTVTAVDSAIHIRESCAVVTACVRIAVYPGVAATSGLDIYSTYRRVYRQVKHYDTVTAVDSAIHIREGCAVVTACVRIAVYPGEIGRASCRARPYFPGVDR